MKHGRAVEAYKAILGLSGQALTLREAYGLHGLKKTLASAWEFQAERERDVVERLGAEILPDGNVRFRTVEEAEEYRREMLELMDMDTEVEPDTVTIKLRDDIRISVKDMEALEGFVTFEEE